MDEELEKCIKDDILLRNKYLESKNNGANQEVLDDIVSSIIENGSKYNEFVEIEVNEEKTRKLEIQMIENYDESIAALNDNIKGFAFLTGLSALATVGTFAFIVHMGPSGGEVLLPVYLSMGATASGVFLVDSLIDKFKYKKEIKQLREKYNMNNEEGSLVR